MIHLSTRQQEARSDSRHGDRRRVVNTRRCILHKAESFELQYPTKALQWKRCATAENMVILKKIKWCELHNAIFIKTQKYLYSRT